MIRHAVPPLSVSVLRVHSAAAASRSISCVRSALTASSVTMRSACWKGACSSMPSSAHACVPHAGRARLATSNRRPGKAERSQRPTRAGHAHARSRAKPLGSPGSRRCCATAVRQFMPVVRLPPIATTFHTRAASAADSTECRNPSTRGQRWSGTSRCSMAPEKGGVPSSAAAQGSGI